MRWVREDYAALARLFAAARRARAERADEAPGALLRRLRRGRQWSQRDLARRAGLARSLIGRVEKGGEVTFGSLRRLMAALGCELVVLPVSDELAEHFTAKAKTERRLERQRRRATGYPSAASCRRSRF